MKTRFSVLGAKTVCIALLCVPMMSCGILGFGADISVSCTDGQRTCADLNESNPTGDACTFWACVDERQCQIIPKDTDRDGVLDNGCEPEGSPPDCDENDPKRFSGNPEVCDYVDNDCDDEVDEGFAYGVTEQHLSRLKERDIESPNSVNFATKSSEQGITMAATFVYVSESVQQSGLAVWSDVSSIPSPFTSLRNKLADTVEGSDPLPPSWLVNTVYTSVRPFIAEDSIGVVASANGEAYSCMYFAARVSQANETLQARIHQAFDIDGDSAGREAIYPASAVTAHGLLVVATKSCDDPTCVGESKNTEVFVQYLVPADMNAWAPPSWTNDQDPDHRIITDPEFVSTGEPATIVALPSQRWLTAHAQKPKDENDPITLELTLIKHADMTGPEFNPYQYTVNVTEAVQHLALAVGPHEGDKTAVVLSYVQDNRAIFKLLELTEAPTPSIQERASVQAPKDSAAHTHPMAVYHPALDEWLLSWHEATSPERFAFVRMTTSGTLIESSLTYGLNREGRVLPDGMGLVYRDQGYGFVSYAEDNEDPRFVTGGIGCPSGN